ncbi:hypothetical protein AVEN_8284-1 [Araneus ventricosus]|uniref:Uncharacterized protein n=1 Tax=Araneus ventricosus TaxID=182803 RepID=A0A4Y2F9P8_ARAVE|nr:hypothetical protein AVEN_8284-1 [Araneus ventricosus]
MVPVDCCRRERASRAVGGELFAVDEVTEYQTIECPRNTCLDRTPAGIQLRSQVQFTVKKEKPGGIGEFPYLLSLLLQTWKVASQQCESYGWEESFTRLSME